MDISKWKSGQTSSKDSKEYQANLYLSTLTLLPLAPLEVTLSLSISCSDHARMAEFFNYEEHSLNLLLLQSEQLN
jgi:hypothetical protein